MELGIISLGDNRPDPLGGRERSAVAHHRELLDLAERSEALGFDSFHVGEHHGCAYITSTPAVVLAAAAARTERITLSTATALLPVHEPVRFAEDYATVDVLSNGRAEVIVSRGILPRSYPDLGRRFEDSRALFRENIELVLALWREETVTWSGRFRPPLDGFTVQPRPVREGGIPLWIGGGFSEESVLLAAELGLPLMLPSVLLPPTHFVPLVETYRSRFVDRGHGPARVGALSHCHVAPDLATARERWAPRFLDYLGWVAGELLPWASLANPDAASAPLDAMRFDFEALVGTGPTVAGSPQQVLDRLATFQEACQLDRQLLHVDCGALPQDILFESLDALASEVAPHLR